MKFVKKYVEMESSNSELYPKYKNLISIRAIYCIFYGFKIKKVDIKK